MAPVWAAEFSQQHVGRALATSSAACQIPWKATTTMQAFLAEALGTMALTIGPNLVVDNPTLQNNEPFLSAVLVALMVVAAVLAAMSFSGGMFHPMLATVLFL